MGDLFKDKLDSARNRLTKKFKDQVKVTDETCFTGFDCYKKVAESDVDLVIMTQPPFFRPQALRAVIEAGKHAFVEKPVATDPAGIRSVLESADLADKKGLTIVAGTQARRMVNRQEVIKRIHDGQIGDIRTGQCFRLGGAMRGWAAGGVKEKPDGMSDMEYQIRRWLFMTWLSGDFIAEMHVHELDIVNWAMGGPPVKALGMGGRAQRTEDIFGNIWDHFAIEYEYENGVRIAYYGRQQDKASGRTYERLIGSKGSAYLSWGANKIEGANPYEYKGKQPKPDVQQHADPD